MLEKIAQWLGLANAPPPEDDPRTRAALDAFTGNLSLYHFFSCPFCARVHRACKRLGVQLELRDVSMDAAHRDALIAGGGRSTVPCLRIAQPDGSVQWMYESNDIVRWLDTRIAEIRAQAGAGETR